jgi:iron(III) transport system permease protein
MAMAFIAILLTTLLPLLLMGLLKRTGLVKT